MTLNHIGFSKDFEGVSVACEDRKKQIEREIMGITEPVGCVDDDELEHEHIRGYYEEDEFTDSSLLTFSEWLKDIDVQAKDIALDDNGDRDNIMYNPLFAAHFLHLCKTMLLWTGMCCQLFKSSNVTASSGNAESAFKNIKQSLAEIIPTSVDNFVKHHLQMIDGDVKEASQKYLTFVGSTKSSAKMNQTSINESSKDESTDEEISNKTCPACSNNDLPTGAHTCVQCGKNVHIFPECSVSIGESEGYGERRKCINCSKSKKRKSKQTDGESDCIKKKAKSNEANEMNYKETWSKKTKTKTKKSKYLTPDLCGQRK